MPNWSLSLVRLGISAGLVLGAWLLATCGTPPSTSSSTIAAGGDILIEYRRTGGIAGFDDHLVIRKTGEATLQSKDGATQVFTVDAGTVSSLQHTIEQAGFFDLESRHRPGQIIPDALQYRITCQAGGRRHTVETSDGVIPEPLIPVIDQLNQIITEH
ncbi:MAG: hypothetical protein D6791_08185 [Chloroflexi bacterium]|nr:MAG: hypothetical protein D6791_08185 [Chloroflexota bacterium]